MLTLPGSEACNLLLSRWPYDGISDIFRSWFSDFQSGGLHHYQRLTEKRVLGCFAEREGDCQLSTTTT